MGRSTIGVMVSALALTVLDTTAPSPLPHRAAPTAANPSARFTRFASTQLSLTDQRSLQRIHIPIVVATFVPPGYRPIHVTADRRPLENGGGFIVESYRIEYANGRSAFWIAGGNFRAGGDPAPDVFLARYTSSIFGPGTITPLEMKPEENCIEARPTFNGHVATHLVYGSGFYFVGTCGSGIPPSELATIVAMTRAVILAPVPPPAVLNAVRSQFVKSDWARFKDLDIPLLLPTTLPPGYRPTDVQVLVARSSDGDLWFTRYTVTYSRGRKRFTVDGNGSRPTAGDPYPIAFAQQFENALLGHGTVIVAGSAGTEKCWTAHAASPRFGTYFPYMHAFYHFYGCDSEMAANGVTRFLKSVAAVRD